MSELMNNTVLPLLATLLTVATPFLVAYLIAYLRKQLRKVGLEATEQELETIRKLAEEAVGYAAQKAKVKVKLGETKLTSQEKKSLAMAFAKKRAAKYAVGEDKMDLLDDLLEAALGSNPEL